MEDTKQLYCPFHYADETVDRVLNQYSIHMTLFYYRTQKLRLTQQEMGVLCGLSTSTIARIESGRDANLSTLLKYAHACGLQLMPKPFPKMKR